MKDYSKLKALAQQMLECFGEDEDESDTATSTSSKKEEKKQEEGGSNAIALMASTLAEKYKE